MKARELIHKSEFTLSEKAVSSEGLGSSSSTITTLTSNADSSPRVNEVAFKPDFVKYLENNNKTNQIDLNNKMNSNEDILSKWRLRRKLEEASNQNNQQLQEQPKQVNIEEYIGKKTPIIAYQAHNLSEQILNMQKQIQLLQPQYNSEIVKSTKKQEDSSEATIKKLTETTGVQTSIDNDVFINEKPTRDENRSRIKLSTNNNIDSKINRRSSKSPIYRTTSASTLVLDRTMSSVQKSNISDLTKISSIEYEVNSLPTKHETDESSSINHKNVNSSEIVVYKKPKVSSSNQIDTDNARINSKLIYETSYYESDEILNILFNKLFFYQSKLK